MNAAFFIFIQRHAHFTSVLSAEHLSKGDNGKLIMAMTALRLASPTGLCPNNLPLATELYYKLREESDDIQKKLLKQRNARKVISRGFDG